MNIFKNKFFLFLVHFSLLFYLLIPLAVNAQTNSFSDQRADSPFRLLRDALILLFGRVNAPQDGVHLPGNSTDPSDPSEPIPTGIFDPDAIPFTPPTGYVYFPQCGGSYGDIPIISGQCTLCNAGCGPTTVAMIIASLVNKSITPQTVINYYRSQGYYLQCDGTYISQAKSALNYFGVRTSDYIIYNFPGDHDFKTIDQAANDLKSYLRTGWTLFALADYCPGGCGHFFWIVNIDDNNNVWAYDPYYGRTKAPPINENQYYPFPRYRRLFGVRK